MKYSLFLLAILLVILSCEPEGKFSDAQPIDTNSIKVFPNQLYGYYLSSEKTDTLILSKTQIIRHYNFYYSTHKDSLETGLKLMGDTLTTISTGEKEAVRMVGDSIFRNVNYYDTLFNILNNDNVLKAYGNYYFLNRRLRSSVGNYWETEKLFLKGNKLIIGSLSERHGDLGKLRKITSSTDENSKFNLSQKEFIMFVRQGGFSRKLIFTRIKKGK